MMTPEKKVTEDSGIMTISDDCVDVTVKFVKLLVESFTRYLTWKGVHV